MIWPSLSCYVDELALAYNKIFDPPAFRGSQGEPPTFEEVIAVHTARPACVRWPARFERRLGRMTLTLPVCGVETYLDFHPSPGPRSDTLVVYHHGLGEIPHDGSAGMILGHPALRERVDWVAIKGPHHDATANVFGRLLETERTFIDGLFSSVFAARAVAAYFRPHYRWIVLAGMSMGGVISLVEQTVGSVFDLTVPIMAGPDLASVLFRSSFSRVVCAQWKRRCEARADLDARLDLAGYVARQSGPPIAAVLARYDRLFLLDAQRAGYARVPRARYEVLSGGHITAALRFRAVGSVVRDAFERELWAASPAKPLVPPAPPLGPAPSALAA